MTSFERVRSGTNIIIIMHGFLFLDILVTQLTDGHASKPYYKDVVKLAKGDPELHIRAKVGATCKDTNEQVQCLIDLATDKAVLGTAWAGWQSYL